MLRRLVDSRTFTLACCCGALWVTYREVRRANLLAQAALDAAKIDPPFPAPFTVVGAGTGA